jgi:hypothetical protein
MLVTGRPPNCGGPGMPQRVIVSSRSPSALLRTIGASCSTPVWWRAGLEAVSIRRIAAKANVKRPLELALLGSTAHGLRQFALDPQTAAIEMDLRLWGVVVGFRVFICFSSWPKRNPPPKMRQTFQNPK